MTLLVTVALVVAGAVLLLVGVLADSPVALLCAALCSAAAVIMLWRVVGKTRDRTFVSEAPQVAQPDWDRPLRPPVEPVDEDSNDPARDQLPPVAIEQYSDLVASEIMPSLETLSIDQLEAVIVRERSGLARPIIISRAEQLIDLTRGGPNAGVDLREELTQTAHPARARGTDTEPLGKPDAAAKKPRATRRKTPTKDQGLTLE